MRRMIITFITCLSLLLIGISFAIPVPSKAPKIKEVVINRISPDLQFTVAMDLIGMLTSSPYTSAVIHVQTREGEKHSVFVESWNDLKYTYGLNTEERLYFVFGLVTNVLAHNNIEAVAVVPLDAPNNSQI
jgi:hypothetical protein